jgi:hypothetical protein
MAVPRSYPHGHVLRVLGRLNDLRAESEAVLVSCGVTAKVRRAGRAARAGRARAAAMHVETGATWRLSGSRTPPARCCPPTATYAPAPLCVCRVRPLLTRGPPLVRRAQPFCEAALAELPRIPLERASEWAVPAREREARLDLTGPDFWVVSVDPVSGFARALSGALLGAWAFGSCLACLASPLRPPRTPRTRSALELPPLHALHMPSSVARSPPAEVAPPVAP